jgi:hypothetical protein
MLGSTTLVFLVLLSFAACDPSSLSPVGPDPTAPPTATPRPIAPAKTIVFCDDETPSYPMGYFTNAASKMADWIDLLAQPAQAGTTVYVQYIKGNSFAEDALIDSFTIPALGPAPLPPIPYPTPVVGDVYGAATATATTRAAATTYSQAMEQFSAQLKAAQSTVKQHTDGLRHVVDHQVGPSDIWGCPQSATSRFTDAGLSHPAGTQKYLVIASDMEMVGLQEQVSVDLTGVQVFVINFKCDDAYSCKDKSDYWTQRLTADHAASVTFLRTDETQVLTQLFP